MDIQVRHYNEYTELYIRHNGREVFSSGFMDVNQSLEAIASLAYACSELTDATKKAVNWSPPKDVVTDDDIF